MIPASPSRPGPRAGRLGALLAAAAVAGAAASGGALVGCTPSLPEPVVNGVHPGWGFNGEDTRVEVEGQAFYPRVQLSGDDRVELDHQFRVFLETSPETELDDVELVDYRHLLATVPAGLSVGTYGVRVETPAGASGDLADAFEVRDTRADQLRVTPVDGQLSWQVEEYAALSIELVDPDGERVAEDLEIQVVADGVEAGTMAFQADTLQDQLDLADGTGIQGRLGPDGTATVALTSAQAAEAVILRVDALDPDSGIEGALQILSFTAGEVAGLRIDLPSPVFDTTAGTRFEIDIAAVDQGGNVVESADTLLVLQELCAGGSLAQSTSFAGQVTGLSVSLTRASNDGCDANAIVAFGLSAGGYVEGQSNLFQVAPGEPTGLDLDVWPDEVVAGQDEVLAFLTATDTWGNRAAEVEGSVEIEASADGGDFLSPSWSLCTALSEGEGYCRALLEQAGQDVVLFATTVGPDAVTGVSEPFTVVPGDAIALQVDVAVDPVVAGQPFELRLQAVDSYGNGVVLDPLGADLATFSDDDGDVACDWDRTDDGGTAEIYACTLTVATAARVIEVEIPSLGLSGASVAFEVINGALDQVAFTLGSDQVVAGEALTVHLWARDAWGNAYVVQDDPVLDLADATGDLDPTSATLAADGAVTLDAVLTVAMEDDHIEASQDGVVLGESAAFDVLAGPAETLAIDLPRTFAWLGEPLAVTVRAVDAFGNTATDREATIRLRSAEGWGEEVSGDLVRGEVVLDFTWDTAGLEDLLTADDGSLSDSASIDALDADCADPPVASLVVDGESPAVLCRLLTTGATRLVTVSAAGSTAGGADLARYHLEDEDGAWTAGVSTSWTRSWDSVGGRTMSVVAADEAACGAVDEVEVYVGDPDGEPTGPVEVVLADSDLRAGDPGADGSTTASIAALDCGGDPAAGGELLVRATLGEIETGTGAVVTTGKGLQLTLDGLGEGELTWSMAEEQHGGQGALLVGRTDAVAFGAATATVVNDATRPSVVDLDPAGTTTQVFDSLSISFTEELLASSVSIGTVRLLDPDGVAVSLAAGDLVLDGAQLAVNLPDEADASTGAWTVQVDSGVRDLDGNLLDGDWSGAASGFSIELGAVPDEAPDITACAVEPALLRPDGDDGGAEEGEQVLFSTTADGVPAWWRLVVISPSGTPVRTAWTPAGASASAEIAWDARADDGAVVDNGAYLVELSPADASWNTGTGCGTTVTIDNRLVAP